VPVAGVGSEADQDQVVLGRHVDVLTVPAPGEERGRENRNRVGPATIGRAGKRAWSPTSDSPQRIARASCEREVDAASAA
jgi:hypothetical protein